MKKQNVLIACIVVVMTCVVVALALKATGAKENKQNVVAVAEEVVAPTEQTDAASGATPQKNEAKAEEAGKEDVEEAVDVFITPDLARNEINAGKVKNISITVNNAQANSISFDKNGNEKYGKAVRQIKRDKEGRVKKIYERVQTDFSRCEYEYVGKSSRMVYYYGYGGYIDDVDGEIGEGFACVHNYYMDDKNQPSYCVSMEGQDVVPVYGVYQYTHFDKYGNWTKRKVIWYYFDFSNDKLSARYAKLSDQLAYAKTEYQRRKIEAQLIPLIRKHHSQKETDVMTRKITYWE